MKKVIFGLAILSLLAFECEDEIEFQGNQRLLLTTRITDSQGNPFEGVPVKVYASRELGFNLNAALRNDFGELMGSGTSDASGNASITSLKPLNASNIYALINASVSKGFKSGFAPLAVNSINETEPTDNTYDLGNTVLDKIELFELSVVRSVNQTDTLEYRWRYNAGVKIMGNTSEYFYLNDFEDNGFGELFPADEMNVHTFNVIESDTILLEYTLINNGIIATEEQQIIVNEQDGTFEFEF